MSYATGYRDLPPLPEPQTGPPEADVVVPRRRLLHRPWVVHLIALVLLLAIWQYLSVVSERVPSILRVLPLMYREITGGLHGGMLYGEFWSHLWISLQRYGIGLAIGIPVGVVLGLLIGTSRWVRGLLNDTMLVLLVLPALVWAFMASLWFGLSLTAPIVTVVLTAVPFVTINFASGVRGIDPALAEMSDSFRVPRKNRVIDLLLGGTLPSAFTGARLAFTTGWNSLLIVEWFGATDGVGQRARFWHDHGQVAGFMGWVLLSVLMITLLDWLVLRRLERHSYRWNQTPTLMFAEDWGM